MAIVDKKLPPIVPVETDPENLFISRDAFIEKRKKKKEFEAKLKVAGEKIKADIESEVKEVKEKKAKK